MLRPALLRSPLHHVTARHARRTPALGMSSSATRKRPLASAATSAAPQKKRKGDPSAQKYYAVRAGMRPGVYLSWDECQAQTTGYKGASCE